MQYKNKIKHGTILILYHKNLPKIQGICVSTFDTGRFPSQTFIDSNTKEVLDGQSGFKKGDSRDFVKGALSRSEIFKGKGSKDIRTYNDTNGCSKSVHVCDYEAGDYDIYIYSPKVSSSERNKGLSFNDHPTVKPLKLLQRVLKYFKTPNPQIVLDCFVGSGSIPIAAIKEGYDYIATELNADYFEIAQKRIFEAKRQTKLF